MRRRVFITLLGGAAVVAWWPVAVRAQQSARVPRMGFLGLGPTSAWASRVEALRQGLRDLGYIEGKNIVIEFRWADGVDQLPEFAAEFVRMQVDIIFASSSTMVEPARQATKTIPIVFAVHSDPVSLGHVASLARPGGNITGLSMLLTDLVAKDLEILMQAVPQAKRIGVLWNPTTPSHQLALKIVETAGEKLGVQLVMVPARSADDFERAFADRICYPERPGNPTESARAEHALVKARVDVIAGSGTFPILKAPRALPPTVQARVRFAAGVSSIPDLLVIS